MWSVEDVPKLQTLLKSVLAVSDKAFSDILSEGTPDVLRRLVSTKLNRFAENEIDEICHVLTKEVSNTND
jgi:hypothetical protein